MKNLKRYFLVITALIPFLASGQAKENNFSIKGKIGAYNAPAKVYLGYISDGKGYKDSAELKNGNFTITGHAPVTPVRAVLVLNKEGDGDGHGKGDDFVSLFIEKGHIVFTNTFDSLSQALPGGTPTNEDLSVFIKDEAPVKSLISARMDKLEHATAEQKADPAFKGAIVAMDKEISDMENTVMKEFVKTHTTSYFSLTLLKKLTYAMDYLQLAPLFNALSADIKESPQGLSLAAQLNKMKDVATGTFAPDFALPDTSGKLVKLSSMRGKYVLIDFWASWCGPCRAENPKVVRIYDKYKDKDFTIVGVSLDQPNAKAKWVAAIKKDGLEWTQLSDLKFWNSEVAKKYGVTAIPQNFLIDPAGKVVAKGLHGDELDKKLAELL